MLVPKKLVVVDDEVDFAEFVADVAECMGFEVSTISDPSTFASLYTHDIDVVVLDLYMPGMDGIELLRFLSGIKSRSSIIFMSGKDKAVLQSAKEIALEQSMSMLGVLQKPFFAYQLEDMLAKYVRPVAVQLERPNKAPTAEELRDAIDKEELFLAYQPQINISNRKVIGVEALVRWRHPIKGMIPPGCFIPIAEQHNLISAISSYVTKTAIAQQGKWKAEGIHLRMSINMSPLILDDLNMPEKMATYLAEMGGTSSDITIEVTETAVLSDIVRYMDILARLRMKGFNLSIDDFGTGYSSLQQLIRAPFTELKIDQAFIRKVNSDKECRTIVKISILLAHELGMHVVAEGIEEEAVWDTLKELGCDEGQGYWMARPMPAKDIALWMKKWSAA
ncbi:MAG: EAL domain-containing protein (putative c-di-GMP-specific phosphodiesterase class I) [Paraglaciecola sp.]|jgi:EAL domain-containing protein (putative c-di-GMP-specific phosphodiesterase class I)